MTLAAFLAVCAGGAALGQMTGTFRRLGPLATFAGLAAACTTALLIGPTDGVTVGEVRLSGSTYASAFLAVAVAACLLLWLVRLGSGGGSDRLAPATMAVLGGLGIAFTAADARVALTAVAAAAVAGTAVAGNASEDSDNRLSEVRTMALLVASLLFASIAVSRPAWTDQDGPVFVLGLLGLAAALAVRSGSVPFHVPAARLAKSGPSMAPALLLVWIPAGLGLVAVSWGTTTFGLRSDALAATVTAIQIVAVATLILGAIGALLHDDLTEIVVYSIVGDSGFILLALASRNGGAAEPARLWLLAFLAAKTGFVAWAVAASHAFGSANLRDLYGWLRRTPLLGLALIAIAAATLGWPGSPVYEARSTLIELALPGSFGLLGPAVIALALLCYGRLLLVGLLTPSEAVRAAAGERPRWSHARPPVATEVAAEVAAPVTAAAKPRKRTSRAAAAAEPPPASTAPPAPPPDEAATAPESPAGPGWRERLVLTWGLNGTLRVSFAVLAAAALSLTLALGGLGASNASRIGITFDAAANSTPRPTPSPTPAPTPSPEPTFAPIGSLNPGTSGGPGASISPGGSGGPSSSPSGSGGPTRSSVPAPLPIR